jgi:hypothetical protein
VWICRTTYLCECLPGCVMDKEALRPLCLASIRKPADVPLPAGRKYLFRNRSITSYCSRAQRDNFAQIHLWSVERAATSRSFLESRVNTTSRHDRYYAPTWSWASLIGSVELNNLLSNSLPSTKIESVQWTPATQNRFGRLSDVRLTVTGILIRPKG